MAGILPGFVPGIVPGRVGAGSREEVMAHYGFTATKITRGGNMRRTGVFFRAVFSSIFFRGVFSKVFFQRCVFNCIFLRFVSMDLLPLKYQ